LAVGAPGVAAAAEPGGRIGFSVPTVVDPIHAFGDATVGIDPLGRVFVSGPTGTGPQRMAWEGSVDGGASFRVITPNLPPTAIQSIEDPPGGGESDMAFDRSGKQYFADLYGLACDRVGTTADGGATVSQSVLGCGTTPGGREWLAVYDPPPGTPHESAYRGPTPLVYLTYDNYVGPGPNGGSQWNKSTDGLTYVNATSGVTPLTEGLYSPFGDEGYPAIDQQTGKVFQAAAFPKRNGTADLLLNIGTPDAAGSLSFLDSPARFGGAPRYGNLIHIADGLPNAGGGLAVLSIDGARNLFAVWSVTASVPARDQVYAASAAAASGWRRWTTPVQLSDGSATTGDAVNVFPWIKAGGAGRADAIWYGSDQNIDPGTHGNQAWNAFMSQVVFPVDSTGAVTGVSPSTSLVKVSPHAIHHGDICIQGFNCILSLGNRNLGDFPSVTIDRTGAAEVAYADASNGLVQPGLTPAGSQALDHAGAPMPTLARQSAGQGLYGTPVGGPASTPVGGISDPPGDARYPVIGGANVAAMDLVGSRLSLSSDRRVLNVSASVVDLRNPAATAATIPGALFLQYVTRWQMGNTIYYAAMSSTAANRPSFYAGRAESVDLCSVSGCYPHVITYPESGLGGEAEHGSISCPALPSAANPCHFTIHVKVADVGNPTATSLLEEVGSYSFASVHPQGLTTNAQALIDDVPLQIDGACCFNFEPR
jgi:hypothetical protein